MITKTHDKLKKFLGKRQNVRIDIELDGEAEDIRGYVVGLSRNLLVLFEDVDFHSDGYKIFRIKDIVEVRRGKHEATLDRIMKFHSFDREPTSPKWLKYGNWASVCRSLKAQGKCIAIQTATETAWFTVGLIKEVGEGYITVKAFDAAAKWIKKIRKFNFKDILHIDFDSKYVNLFYEYMKSLK